MAPLVGWDWFEEDKLKGNLPYERLFPKDVAKWNDTEDLHGETCALQLNVYGPADMSRDQGVGHVRSALYNELNGEATSEYFEVLSSWKTIHEQSTPLQRCEYFRFD